MSKGYIKYIGRSVAISAFAFAVALSPLSGVEFAHAAVGTQTWSGAAGDGKFSTAGNWVENEVPEAGDSLVFNTASTPAGEDYDQLLDNDVDVVYASVLVNGGSGEEYLDGYRLKNDLKLQPGSNWTVASDKLEVRFDTGAKLKVAGDLLLSLGDYGYFRGGILDVSGVLTVRGNNSQVLAAPHSLGGLSVENSNAACIGLQGANKTIPYPITLGGGASAGPARLSLSDGTCSMMGGGGSGPVSGLRLTLNNVTLLSNSEVSVSSPHSIEVKNLTKNGHTLTRSSYSTGQLITADGTQENQAKTTRVDGSKPDEDLNVTLKETAILNGERGYATVGQGGTLKGQGTVRSLGVYGGVVSPGNSPGKITVVEYLSLSGGSTFQAEILNKDAYDQIIVNGDNGGNVQIDSTAKLDLSFLPGGDVKQGDTFTIIDNKSSTDINGTFAGLAEGARISIGSAVFSISYKGGTGNDVVLTALTTAKAPGTPNTGFQLLLANPALVAGIGIAAAGALLIATRRLANK